ncbi:hypothetical protein KCU92_g9050, partial [Aureobasidium melanogenum]|jgi:hypothetical protein
MPPKGRLRPPHMRNVEPPKIFPKPPSMSRAGVFSSSSDDDHDISSPASVERSPPTQPPVEEAEILTSVAPGWAHAGVQVPTMDSYAIAPSVAAPAPFVFGNSPSYPSLTSLEADAASAMFDSMFLGPGRGYDQRLAYQHHAGQTQQVRHSMYGAMDEIQQDFNESPLMLTSQSQQVPVASHSSEHMMSWQTEINGFDSAYNRFYPTYTPLALEENSAYSLPYGANFRASAPPAMTQFEAGAWDTEPNGNMRGAPVSFISQHTPSSSGNMRGVPVSFTQQTPSSIVVPVNNQMIGHAWRGYNGTGMPGPSNDHLPAPTLFRHSQELQQSPVNASSGPSASLAHEPPRKRRRVTLQ